MEWSTGLDEDAADSSETLEERSMKSSAGVSSSLSTTTASSSSSTAAISLLSSSTTSFFIFRQNKNAIINNCYMYYYSFYVIITVLLVCTLLRGLHYLFLRNNYESCRKRFSFHLNGKSLSSSLSLLVCGRRRCHQQLQVQQHQHHQRELPHQSLILRRRRTTTAGEEAKSSPSSTTARKTTQDNKIIPSSLVDETVSSGGNLSKSPVPPTSTAGSTVEPDKLSLENYKGKEKFTSSSSSKTIVISSSSSQQPSCVTTTTPYWSLPQPYIGLPVSKSQAFFQARPNHWNNLHNFRKAPHYHHQRFYHVQIEEEVSGGVAKKNNNIIVVNPLCLLPTSGEGSKASFRQLQSRKKGSTNNFEEARKAKDILVRGGVGEKGELETIFFGLVHDMKRICALIHEARRSDLTSLLQQLKNDNKIKYFFNDSNNNLMMQVMMIVATTAILSMST